MKIKSLLSILTLTLTLLLTSLLVLFSQSSDHKKLKKKRPALAVITPIVPGVQAEEPPTSTSSAPKPASSVATNPSTTTNPPPAPAGSEGNEQMGRRMMLEAGFDQNQWPCLQALWDRESGWSEHARNPRSGAAGIPQALPPSKMGHGWQGNAAHQIAWGLRYIRERWDTPCAADAHQRRRNWY